jgi:ELWxxDGT repeat protein
MNNQPLLRKLPALIVCLLITQLTFAHSPYIVKHINTDGSGNRLATNSVRVDPLPQIPTSVSISKTAIVSGGAVILSATCSLGSVIWYNQLTGGAAIGMGTSMGYYPASTGRYYAACKEGGSESSRVATSEVVVTTMNLLPYMVKDVIVVPDDYPDQDGSATPNSCNVNGILYFRGKNTANGIELWKSDGTVAGTVLIKDINPGTGNSDPENLTNINGIVFFAANDGVNGTELWKSDGTPEGTVMVRDINTSGNSLIRNFISFNGELYFSASTNANNLELWKSNGTVEGTVMVKDINPNGSSWPSSFLNRNGTLYFSATDGDNNYELWKSDGTEGGTELVKDINPSGSSYLNKLMSVNETFYFSASNLSNNYELWKSNGTADGTEQVKDINTITGPSSISYLTNVNGTLFFSAYDGTGHELWKSDGTTDNTVMVKDIRPVYGSGPSYLTNINGTVFFAATDGMDNSELWKSDGTLNGTVLVKDINPSGSSSPSNLINFNGTLYFRATTNNNNELWKSDGTTGGTVLVKDINPSASSYPQEFINVNGKLYFGATGKPTGYDLELWSLGTCTDANILVNNFNKTLYYNSQVQPSSNTLTCHCDVFNNLISTVKATGLSPVSGEISAKEWIEETASAAYVRRHYEINPATNATTATGRVTLYFTQADFDAYNTASNNYKLPVNGSDNTGITNVLIERRTGTSTNDTGLPGTYIAGIETIDPENADVIWNSNASRWEISFNTTGFGGFFLKSETPISPPTAVTVNTTTICAGSSVSLTATCEAGTVVWYNQATGGSAVGTGSPFQVSPITSTAYYAACETGETSSNRVATNTVNVNPTPAIPTGVSVNKTAIISGATVNLNATCSTGYVVWYTQQTGGSSIGAGLPFRYYPSTTTTFYAACKIGNCESSRVVATSQVTVTSMVQVPYMVKDIQAGNNAGQTNFLTNVNGIVFFESGDDEGHGKELWKTDGTAAGTMMVKDINVGSNNSDIYNLTNVNGILYFRAADNTHGIELWKSDGTTNGTQMVKEIKAGLESTTLNNFINVNGTLYFTANDNASGVELWKTDGSEDGTQLVKNIAPGTANSNPGNLVNADGTLYFIADDGTNEKELWRTDGTEAGTVMMTNLAAGQFPMELVYFMGSVFYSVRTQNTFRASLWKSSGIPGGDDVKLNTTDQVEIYKLTAVNGVLYFASDDFIYGNELWKTDGTTPGTTIVKDIRLAGVGGGNSSSPMDLINMNGTLFFTADDGTNGRELWKSNGTDVTTTVVKNIVPGGNGPQIANLTNVNDILYFQARDQGGDIELWQTDGTEGGTFRAKDLWPGYGSSPNNLVNVNGKLFFRAGTILNGVPLGYEPLALGTCTIANILFSNNGKSVNYNSQQQVSPTTTSCHCDMFNNLISTIDAIGVNPVSGEISTKEWIEETASEGYVRRHYEINPVSGDTTVTGKVTLYFTQADFEYFNDAAGSSTYPLPGNSSDTEAISKIRIERRTGISTNDTGLPGTYTKGIETINPVDADIIWNSDASRWEVSFNTTGFGGYFLKSAIVQDPTEVFASATTICEGGSAYLTANCATGVAFWYTDASGGEPIDVIGSTISVSPSESTIYYTSCEAGPIISNRIIADTISVIPYPEIPTVVSVNKTAIVNGASVTLSATCSSGNAVWYDQLSGGASIGMGSPLVYYPASTASYYAACKNSVCESNGERAATNEVEVTAMDLVPYMVKDISSPGGSSPGKLFSANGKLYFGANDVAHGNELWQSDAFSGTTLVKDINLGNGGVSIENLIDVNGTTFFSVQTETAFELWKTNGTEESTKMVKSIWGYGSTRKLTNFLSFNNILYFIAYDSDTYESKLWRSDGTNRRTVIAQNLNADDGGILLTEAVLMNGMLYFPANKESRGVELWKSDGTNTTLVKDIFVDDYGLPAHLTVVNSTLYFSANDGLNGIELWKSDGLEGGTVLVEDIFEGGDGSDPTQLTNINGTLYFVANDGNTGRELWKSNGLVDNTELVKDINDGETESNIINLTDVNGTLFFTAYTPEKGNELWKSNGESGNTSIVKDINPDAESSAINYLTNLNGILYFQARNSSDNTELWKSDGTGGGTMMMKEINPGDDGSLPSNLTIVNGKMYFNSNTVFDEVNYGTELWSLGICTDDNTIVSSNGRSLNFNSQTQSTTTCHCDVFNNLIGKVEATGDNPVSGEVQAKEWIDAAASEFYVKRHYEINPATDAATATGKITLYFTQADFDAYYAANTSRMFNLPLDHCDIDGIKNIRIEKREGISSDDTGIPETYSGATTIIDPADEDIFWSGEKQRWVVSFTTTGFGGFFAKSFELTDPTEVVASQTTICAGTSVSLTANCAFGTVTWHMASSSARIKGDGSSIIGTGSPLVITPTPNTIYLASCKYNDNESGRFPTADITINAVPAFPTAVSVNTTAICSGTEVLLIATCATGTITWYDQASGGASVATGTASQSPTVNTIYYASCVDSDCESSREATSQVVVTTQPTSPEVSVDFTAICSGESVALTALCASGTVIWYNQSSGGSVIGTSTTLSRNPTVNTKYYASCKNVNCESSREASETIVVTTQPQNPSANSVSNTAICSGTSVSLSATCLIGTINWYNQSSLIGTVSPLIQSPTETTTYYVSCKNGNCETNWDSMDEIVVTAQPTIPTAVSVDNTAICSGTAISLTATCATGIVTWYNQSSGGSVIGTVSPLSQSPSTTTTYYASCKNGNCESSRIATNEVVVTTTPGSPTGVSVNYTSVCINTPVSLTATCASGTIKWFRQASGGVSIGTGSPLSYTPSSADSFTLYASCFNGNCESNRIATSAVTVSSVPKSPQLVSASSTAICSGTAITLSSTPCGSSNTITWYNQATGGSAIGTGTGLSQSPFSTITYYASCKISGGNCESSRRATSQIVVTTMPTIPTSVSVNNTTICNGTAVSLTATCATGTIKWFTQETGGSTIGTGSPLSQSPSASTTYYTSCATGDCASTRVATSPVVVTAIPTIPTEVSVNNNAICSGTEVSLSATCATGTITWYDQASGGSVIGTVSPLSQSPSITTTYYASCKNENCESSRVATNPVVVTTMPTSPTAVSVNNTAICSGTEVSLTAACTTGTITWYNQSSGGSVIGTVSPLSQSPSTTTTYYASCKNENCESSRVATNQVVVTTQPTIPTGVSVNNAAICSGTAISLTAACATGTITWYNQSSGGSVIGTGTGLSQSPLVHTAYYASCKNGNCESSRVATTVVVVTTQPTNPTEVSVDKIAICSGTSVSLTATCATGTITWYNQSSGGSSIGTVSPLSQSPSTTTTYYASCKNGNCETSRVATSAVVVTTQPIIPTSVSISNTAICNGTSVSLTANCTTGTLKWYNQATGGTAVGTGNALSQSPGVNTIYYAACESGVCVSSRIATSEVVVTLIPSTPSVSVSKTSICNGASVSLTATCTTGTPVWYNQPNGGTAVGTGTPLTQSPTVNTYYYASCKNGNCESGRRGTSLVTVNQQPGNPTSVLTDKAVLCTGESITLSASCTLGTVNWYASTNGGTANTGASIGTGNSLVLTATVAATYIYVAECKTATCTSEKIATAEVLIKPTPNKPVISGTNDICPGESTTLSAYSDNTFSEIPTYHWTDDLTGNSITVTPPTIKFYTVIGSFNGCTSESSDVFYVYVNPVVEAPTLTATKTAICAGDSAVLTGQCASEGYIFHWKIAQLRTNTITLDESSVRTVKTTGTYKAWCESTWGCKSAEASISITQDSNCNGQNIIVISPEKPIICPNTSVTLSASGCSGVITWTGGTTGTSAVYNPTVNTTYTAQCSTGGSSTVEVKIATADFVVGSDIITGSDKVKATTSIESAKKIGLEEITPGASVSYESGGSIIMKPGFVVEKGSVFKAEIKTCN